jgi:hypothetical protein
MNRILNADRTVAPFRIVNLENTYSFILPVISDGSQFNVLTGGNIDRIDVVKGVTRIVDYKSGTVSELINSISDLFTEDRKKDADGWLQTLLYSEAYLASSPVITIRPSVYKIKKLGGTTFSDKLRVKTGTRSDVAIENYTEVRDEFVSGLKDIVGTIFKKDEPFIKTKDTRGKCTWCPYKTLCMR